MPSPTPSALDAKHSTGHGSWPLAHPAAVIARLDDPLSARCPSGDHADVVGPHHDRADARSTRTAPILPCAGGMMRARACRFSRGDDSERCGVPIAKRATDSRTLSSIRLSLGKGAAPGWESLKPSQQKYSRRRKVSPSSDFLRAVLRKAPFSKILRRNEEVAEAVCGPQRLIADAVR